jgi:hypothetical protein
VAIEESIGDHRFDAALLFRCCPCRRASEIAAFRIDLGAEDEIFSVRRPGVVRDTQRDICYPALIGAVGIGKEDLR